MSIIKYFAEDKVVGRYTKELCKEYRAYAKTSLKERFPEHKIEVLDKPHLYPRVETDDAENRDFIRDFVNIMWARWVAEEYGYFDTYPDIKAVF